jgi:hypothetical protein
VGKLSYLKKRRKRMEEETVLSQDEIEEALLLRYLRGKSSETESALFQRRLPVGFGHPFKQDVVHQI